MKTLYRRTYMVVILAALVIGAMVSGEATARLALATLAGGLTFALIYSRGVALDDLARGLEAERAQTRILELLLRGGGRDLGADLEEALQEAVVFCRAEVSFIGRCESDDLVRILASTGDAGDSAELERIVASQLVEHGALQPIEAVVRHGTGLKSLLLVPVLNESQLWGVIGITDHRGGRSWDGPEIPLLRVAAGVMSAACGRALAEAATREAMETARASCEAKGRFLANMSHEIRTPLNCVVGLSEHLYDLNPTPEQLQNLDLIRHSGDVLLQVITDILDLSRIEAGGIEVLDEEFDLGQLLDNTVGMFNTRAEEKGLALELDLAVDLPTIVRGDEARLGQVLTNLLGNAIKFTREGGVCLAVSAVAPTRFRFDVIDSGIGIADDKLGPIFESFTQADASTTRLYGGTGLGLAISRSLADLMDGTLAVASIEGQGSVFSLVLPLAVVAARLEIAAAADCPHQRTDSSFAGTRVLVVEDHPLNQTVARKLLESLGCDVTVAEDGTVALDLLRWQEFDLILMDFMMPGMDGPETTRRLRARGGRLADVAVVALTANALGSHEITCREAGMDGFLTKPIRKQDLVGVLLDLPVATVSG